MQSCLQKAEQKDVDSQKSGNCVRRTRHVLDVGKDRMGVFQSVHFMTQLLPNAWGETPGHAHHPVLSVVQGCQTGRSVAAIAGRQISQFRGRRLHFSQKKIPSVFFGSLVATMPFQYFSVSETC